MLTDIGRLTVPELVEIEHSASRLFSVARQHRLDLLERWSGALDYLTRHCSCKSKISLVSFRKKIKNETQ